VNRIAGIAVGKVLDWTKRKIRLFELAGSWNGEKPGVPEGESLDETTKTEMESLLGYDFGNVLIHKTKQAANLSRNMEADAFTIGTHIFAPEENISNMSINGKALLAHELVHVIQQTQPPHTLTTDNRMLMNQPPEGNINTVSHLDNSADLLRITITQLAPSVRGNSGQTSDNSEKETEAQIVESNIRRGTIR
jgi:hypothetical protein